MPVVCMRHSQTKHPTPQNKNLLTISQPYHATRITCLCSVLDKTHLGAKRGFEIWHLIFFLWTLSFQNGFFPEHLAPKSVLSKSVLHT